MRRTVRGHSFPLSNNRENERKKNKKILEERRENGRATSTHKYIFVYRLYSIIVQYIYESRRESIFVSPFEGSDPALTWNEKKASLVYIYLLRWYSKENLIHQFSLYILFSFLMDFFLLLFVGMAIKREETCLKDVYDLYDEAHLYARNVVHVFIIIYEYTMEEIKWKNPSPHVWWSIFVFKAYAVVKSWCSG